MPGPSSKRVDFGVRGGGVLVDQWGSVTKIRAEKDPSQVVNDREKRGCRKRAEPDRIRIQTTVSGDHGLPQAGNQRRAMAHRLSQVGQRMRSASPEAGGAADNKSAMFRVCQQCQLSEMTMMAVCRQEHEMFGVSRHEGKGPLRFPIRGRPVVFVLPKTYVARWNGNGGAAIAVR